MQEKTLGPDHPGVANTLVNLAGIYRDQGKALKAEPLLKCALTIQEGSLGRDHPGVATTLNNLAEVQVDRGAYAEAEPKLRRALKIREQTECPDHPDVASTLTNLAFVTVMVEGPSDARPLYERARQIVLRELRDNADLDDKGLRALVKRANFDLGKYVELLGAVASEASHDSTASSAASDSFRVAEQVRGGAAQMALALAAARAAAANGSSSSVARSVQDLRRQRQAILNLLRIEYGKPSSERDMERTKNLVSEEQRIDSQLRLEQTELFKALPRYAELIAPDPVDPASAAQMLGPDEALVEYFVLDRRVLAWVVKSNVPLEFRQISIGRQELAKMVKRVRKSLSSEAPYDVSDAFEIYKRLLEPFTKSLAGVRHLIVIPDDAVLPIPFAALITSSEGEAYAKLRDGYAKGFAPSRAERGNCIRGLGGWRARISRQACCPRRHRCVFCGARRAR
jgi:tetratricopeptide (TPR) repeat protein